MKRVLEITDDGLIRRMLAGDEHAFTLLYQRRQPAIFRFALHMSGSAAVAEDVAQEVFMTLIRDAKRFDPERGTVGAFLFGVARNHLRKRWEQDRHSVPLAEDADELGHNVSSGAAPANGNGHFSRPHDEFDSRETVGRVRQAIATLPEGYREVVALCELEELSYEEASKAMGCPVGTIRSRLHRARALLVEKLREPLTVRRAAASR
jgi:RNA polymerase sigma-70 factor, ECF subfamily